MLEVTVKFRGSVRDVVGSARDVLVLPAAATVRDLIDALVARHGTELAGRLLTPDGQLRTSTRLFVEGNEVQFTQLAAELTHLAEGAAEMKVEIFVIQMTMGG